MNAPTNANLLVAEGGALELSPKAAALAAKDVAKLNSLSYSELAAGWKNIPSELAELRGWLLWRWVMKPKADKPTKVPVYAKTLQNRSGEQGTEADRGNLCTLAEAIDVLRRVKKTDFAGVGLAMLADWNITALDFDHVIDGEKVAPWVSELVNVNVTYGEASPSDTGARVFYRGMMPPALRDKKHKEGDTGFEIFCAKGFVTVTGKELGIFSALGAPLPALPESVVTFAENPFQRARTDSGAPTFDPDDPFSSSAQKTGLTIEECRRILDLLPEHRYDDREKWLRLIFAVHHEFYGTEFELDALEMVDDWSAQSVKFATGVVAAIWENAKRERAGGLVTMRTVLHWLLHEDGFEGEWKAYQAERKAAASAAVVQERDWFARIAAADQVEIEGSISAEIRAADVSSTQREQLAQAISRRFANLGRPTGIAAARRLVAAPRAVLARPGDVDLKEFIPYGFPVPALSPATFPHHTMTENTISLKNTMENTQRLLEAYGITVFYDVIRKKASLRLPGLKVCPDQADNAALSWVTSLAALNDLNGEKAAEYAVTTAFQRPRNTVADWIKSKPWDGKDRVAQLCNTLTVRPGFPQSLRDLVVRRWLISAVAAAMKPAGFYSKGVLVLQGPQSIGKTPWVANLLPDTFADYVHLGMHLDPSNRDSVKTAVSHWIVELGEVDSTMNRADVAMLKAFISQRTDKVRLPYARVDSEFPRRTVFFASVNPEEFLRDDTGNVRWWTVPVTAVDYEHGIDLQQLWAQVAAAYEEGERWWLVREEEAQLEACNAGHVVRSAIHDMLSSMLDFDAPKTEWKRLSASGVLHLLKVKTPTNAQSKDAGAALRALVGASCGKTNGSPCWWVPPLKFEKRGSDLLEE